MDIGGTNRYSVIINNGAVKIWIFSKTLQKKTLESINDLISTSKSASTTSESVDVEMQLDFILNNNDKFIIVLQLPGQEMQHSGIYPHAVITLIDPIVNPSQYCLSVGYRIANISSMTKIVTPAINKGTGEGMSYQGKAGYLQSAITIRKGKTIDVINDKKFLQETGKFISVNIKQLGAAKTTKDVAEAKLQILTTATTKALVNKLRVEKTLSAKKSRKQQKIDKFSNLRRSNKIH
jgi:hypothetical protein